MSKKVYIVKASEAYISLFKSLGFTLTFDPQQADIACFTGGADVSPHMYGAEVHPQTHNDAFRDAQEAVFFKRFQEDGVPCVGICRGGQFLNVMSGGTMYQHVTKHLGDHQITDLETGETIMVSSTHHQMMKPSPDALLVASSGLRGDREWVEGNILKREVSEEDVEVVYYPHTNCLCFQPHPEFTAPHYKSMREYFDTLLQRFFFEEEVKCGCC